MAPGFYPHFGQSVVAATIVEVAWFDPVQQQLSQPLSRDPPVVMVCWKT